LSNFRGILKNLIINCINKDKIKSNILINELVDNNKSKLLILDNDIKRINDNLDNVISYESLPYPVITTIIPFKNVLIYDSILQGIPTKMDPIFTNSIIEEYKKLMKYYHL